VVGKGKSFTPTEPEEDETDINVINKKFASTPAAENTPATENTPAVTSTVPLPTEEDIIRLFFNLINEKKIPDAVSMMSKSITGDDSTKQAWGVQFNALESVKVQNIEPARKESWSQNSHEYKVTLDVSVSPQAANATIPYYGWDNGSNLRWVEIVKEDEVWKINQIATGP